MRIIKKKRFTTFHLKLSLTCSSPFHMFSMNCSTAVLSSDSDDSGVNSALAELRDAVLMICSSVTVDSRASSCINSSRLSSGSLVR